MDGEVPDELRRSDLPNYVVEPLEKQSPDRLETIGTYALELAEWKRSRQDDELERRRTDDAVNEEDLERLSERDISTDPEDYDDVPSNGAYVTIKTTKESSGTAYRYYYWQWRDGDTWKNEYIAPVEPR